MKRTTRRDLDEREARRISDETDLLAHQFAVSPSPSLRQRLGLELSTDRGDPTELARLEETYRAEIEEGSWCSWPEAHGWAGVYDQTELDEDDRPIYFDEEPLDGEDSDAMSNYGWLIAGT